MRQMTTILNNQPSNCEKAFKLSKQKSPYLFKYKHLITVHLKLCQEQKMSMNLVLFAKKHRMKVYLILQLNDNDYLFPQIQFVKEIKFEQVYIQRLKQKAERTNKIRDWLLLLKAYQQNNFLQEKDKTIQIMHMKFILNQSFWIQQIKRKQNQQSMTQQDIQFILMALDDGYYLNTAQHVIEIMIKQLNKNQHKTGKLRPNYLLAKIQYIFSIFGRTANLFPPLRNYYKNIKNDKKTRQLYLRQIKLGFNDFDIIYDEYLHWEKDITQAQKSKSIYQIAKQNWELQYHQGSLSFLTLHHFENIDFYKYLKIIQQLSSDLEKLRYLRIFCLSRHQLVNQYFSLLQCINIEDEQQVIQKYKNLIGIIPNIQTLYLKFLVRRINKHKHQPQDETYNTVWTQKVIFFRNQITFFINKCKDNPITQQQTKQMYYIFWIKVQTALVKDKQSICQLFQALLQINPSIYTYIKYSDSMIILESLPDAKQILKRCCQAFKGNHQALTHYSNFLDIYGTIHDVIEFQEKQIKQKYENMQLFNHNHVNNLIQQHRQNINNNTNIDNQQKKYEKQMKVHQTIRKEDQQTHQKYQQHKNILCTPPTQKQLTNKKSHQENGDDNNNQHIKKKMHTDSGNTLYIKGFPPSWKEEEVRQIIKNKTKIKQIRLIQKKGIPQSYCYVDMASQQDALNQIQQNEHKEQYQIAISRPPSLYNEDKTLFLGGLPHNTTIDTIRTLFKQQQNHIMDIRLKIDQNRNIGYIDFSTPQIRTQVYEKYSHKTLQLQHKKISIQLSTSTQNQIKNKVLIIKQLAYHANQKDIVHFFNNYTLQDIYIPKNQKGKSKGFAFVQFKNLNQFYQALSIQKGSIKGRIFEIQKSERDIQRPKSNNQIQISINTDNKIDNNYFNDLFK